MPTALDQRLASRVHQQWITTLTRVDSLTRAVGVVYNRLERELLGLMAAESVGAIDRAGRAIDTAWADVGRLVRSRFEALALDAHRRTAKAIWQTIPARWFAPVEPMLAFTERLADEPVQRPLTDEEKRELFDSSVFPPPPPEKIERYLTTAGVGTGGATWDERLAYWSAPTREALLGEMLTGAAGGESLSELRKRIKPLVGGINYKAQRIVRTEGRRVAERAQMEAYNQCGELIGAMQIIATLDGHTRPEHAARHGRTYDRQPDGSYQTIDGQTLPDLPDAPNCRCFASPVLAAIPEIEASPEVRIRFANAQADVIADPAAYSRWFDRATELERATVVGKARYRAVAKRSEAMFGRRPEWEDFLDPDGKLLSLGQLKRGTLRQWLNRRVKVAELIGDRERLVARLLATAG